MSTTLNIAGSIALAGSAGTIAYAPAQIVNATPCGGTQAVTLGTGEVSVSVPAGAKFFGIVPPTGNAVSINVFGVTGETGISVDPVVGVPCMSLATGQTHVFAKAGSTITVEFIFG